MPASRSTTSLHRPVVLAGVVAVLLTIVSQLSLYPVYLVQRSIARHEMKSRVLAGLPASALTVFRFTPTELQYVEFEDEGNELVIDGALYDIVRIYRDANDRVVVEAVRDDEENQLLADLGRRADRYMMTDPAGRNVRLSMVHTWAVYCEPWPVWMQEPASASGLAFAELSPRGGRGIDAVEPGPPRSA